MENEQVEQAILLSLRKAFKGLVVALLARMCRVKVSSLRKYMQSLGSLENGSLWPCGVEH